MRIFSLNYMFFSRKKSISRKYSILPIEKFPSFKLPMNAMLDYEWYLFRLVRRAYARDAKKTREKKWPREILGARSTRKEVFFRATHDGLSERATTRSLMRCYNTLFISNILSIICQVVAFGRLTTKENFKLLALQVVAVAYKSCSLPRGSKYSDLTWKLLVFWKTGRWGEMVAYENWLQP